MNHLHKLHKVIELQNVSKIFQIDKQEVPALTAINLEVNAGEMIAITGKSGAGKSTLLHIIGTLERPTSGNIILSGSNVSEMPDTVVSTFRNATIGFVFQMSNLLPEFSALENVMMPGLISAAPVREIRERAHHLLVAVGLAEREKHRPSELSGGEQQRVAIARALLMAPPILLADEPTGNLDQKSSHDVTELLFALCQTHKMTMLLVTHDLNLASRFPNRIIMEDGRIIERN